MRWWGCWNVTWAASVAACGRRVMNSHHRLHSTTGIGTLSALRPAEEEAQLFSQLSEALFADEAAALSLSLPDISDCAVPATGAEEEAGEPQLSAEACMEVVLDPPLPLLTSRGNEQLNEEGLQTGSTVCETQSSLPSFSHAMEDLSLCRDGGGAATALATAVRAFMSSDTSVMNRAASELILAGSDVKALFPDGTLCGIRMEHKCMSQCDFSTVSFLSVYATEVDFSRSLFYGAIFHDCVFVRCCFDGCVLKELRCSGNVRFEDCSFRFANIELRLSRGDKSTRAKVMFERGDFDLADFSGSDRLPARCFVDCCNTEIAAKFPPTRV
ncbi:hypothetical protein TraAM80_10341 [Trypanosoma rangeli]|uniref:Pentapeptide repeat-containing protein n=1 Tax=Trypanosoma rangeli TaxID=5698 RepID=A0A3R7MTW6_TRYRA|nr:uncharacterized protein TraAM80_10341 [Trypanosoma rangeli]RNE95204.1 hypothetical protein TraAM80_10341 [Trypanosoma rangeli]|eukprot:RNE95204.1 hypothetical protein TraAM80_10341 [Trypanosoma rangeli]